MSRIFIAEDQPDLARVLKTMLEEAGHEIRTFSESESALKAMLKDPPDALIADVDMASSGGCTLCEQIDRCLPRRRFPIFLLASNGTLEGLGRYAAMADVHVMQKPVALNRIDSGDSSGESSA